MSADFRALCAELVDSIELLLAIRSPNAGRMWTTERRLRVARAALSVEPAVPEVVGSEWQPCVKLPITVHVREQCPGEQHVSTREGITPVQSDDLIMLGVDGEEYPIGRELFQRTYRMGSADEPAVPESREPAAVTAKPSDEDSTVMEIIELSSEIEAAGLGQVDFARAVLARWGNPAPVPPADGEVAELVAKLRRLAPQNPLGTADPTITRAADLLERLSPPQPVPVGERPWEREEWCDTDGLCWLGSHALDGSTPTWLFGPPAWAERFPTVHRVLLPAHALPLPEVGE